MCDKPEEFQDMQNAVSTGCPTEDNLLEFRFQENHAETQYHKPNAKGLLAIRNIRLAAEHFMNVIDANCHTCEDSREARRKVHEAMMTANKTIAIGGARG